MADYQINASEEQLELIMKSLDFYSRIQMGQVSELTNPYLVTLPNADYSEVNDKLLELKKMMFPDLEEKSIYSIRTKRLSDTIRQSVDILDVIRHRLAWDKTTEEKPSGLQYNKPINWSTETDLIKIKKVDE